MKWTVILTNNSGNTVVIGDLGFEMIDGESRTISDTFTFDELSTSSDLKVAIASGDFEVNDGIDDLDSLDGEQYIFMENVYHTEETYAKIATLDSWQHSNTIGRSNPYQHPIGAITNLTEELSAKASIVYVDDLMDTHVIDFHALSAIHTADVIALSAEIDSVSLELSGYQISNDTAVLNISDSLSAHVVDYASTVHEDPVTHLHHMAGMNLGTYLAIPAGTEGEVYWDSTAHTLSVVTGLGNVIQVGQEMFGVGVNKTGVNILGTELRVVYNDDIDTNKMTFQFADATDQAKCFYIGITTAAIANNAEGPVTTYGMVNNVNTGAYEEGDWLWVAPDATGVPVNIKPSYPHHSMFIGIVVKKNVNVGAVFVMPQHSYHEWIQRNSTNIDALSASIPQTGNDVLEHWTEDVDVASSTALWTNNLGTGNMVLASDTTSKIYGADAWCCTIMGEGNIISGTGTGGTGLLGCTIGGGDVNLVSRDYGTIWGGFFNINDAFMGVIVHGYNNEIAGGEDNGFSFIGSGQNHYVNGQYSSIVGGSDNELSGGQYSFIGGGDTNNITSTHGGHVICGGSTQTIDSANGGGCFIGGGDSNKAQGQKAVVCGGIYNEASGQFSFIGGGGDADVTTNRNEAKADWTTVVGGRNNVAEINALYAFIGGGDGNTVYSNNSTIGGGFTNTVSDINSTIAGGYQNSVAGSDGSIGGGRWNKIISGTYNVIAGGGGDNSADGNIITGGNQHVIGGGTGNTITTIGGISTICGGDDNSITAAQSTICGGYGNSIASINAVIIGGINNEIVASGEGAVAIGSYAKCKTGYGINHSARSFDIINKGDRQVGYYILGHKITNSTKTWLSSEEGDNNSIFMDDNQTMSFMGTVTARTSGDIPDIASWKIEGVATADSTGNVVVHDYTVTVIYNPTSWTIDASIETAGIGQFSIGFTGTNWSEDIRVVAQLSTSEVTFA